jgi:hypothetical protein
MSDGRGTTYPNHTSLLIVNRPSFRDTHSLNPPENSRTFISLQSRAEPRAFILPSLAGFCSCPYPVNVTLHPIFPSPVRPFTNAAEQHYRGYKAEHCNQINHPFSHSNSPTPTLPLPLPQPYFSHSLIDSFIQLLIHALSQSLIH